MVQLLPEEYMQHGHGYRTWIHLVDMVTHCDLQRQNGDTWTTIDTRTVPMTDFWNVIHRTAKHAHPKQQRKLERLENQINSEILEAIQSMIKGVVVDG